MELTPIASPQPYAGFWRRCLACIIDGLLLGTLNGILAVPIILIGIAGFTQQKQALHDILAQCLVMNKV